MNNTGLGFNKFIVVENIKNASSGKPIIGNTYEITFGDKDVLKAQGKNPKDWFICTTPIIRVAAKNGGIIATK